MHFDDRLATVLHHRAAGERAARVQFRQLLDLLGQPGCDPARSLTQAAFRRLDALALLIPAGERARIAGECSARIRNAHLIAWLADSEPQVALAALANASLADEAWSALIPELPVRARGLLRHRRDLPRGAVQWLERLGVHDRALPEPAASEDAAAADIPADRAAPFPALDLGSFPEEDYVLSGEPDVAPVAEPAAPAPAAAQPVADTANLGALVRRIEEFQRAREQRRPPAWPDSPRLPLGGAEDEDAADLPALGATLFTTDETGRIDWAEPGAAPLLIGTRLAGGRAGDPFAAAFTRRRPLTGAAVDIAGAPSVAGRWIIDAAPRFAPQGGQFTGYVGRLRRPSPAAASSAAIRAADRVRQLLHELRTPVTAIQGFAEVIQQQTVGPVPHDYRAIAAGIAGDAARMLAGFAELERLARLEAGVHDLAEGDVDFAVIARRLVAQLQTVLSPRVSRIEAEWRVKEARLALSPDAAEGLAWRFLGTIAAATAAGERVALDLTASDDRLRLSASLPAALAQADDIFASDVRPAGGALGLGLFGAGFALRLARAEARMAGGDLLREAAGQLTLVLPLAAAERPDADAPQPSSERIRL